MSNFKILLAPVNSKLNLLSEIIIPISFSKLPNEKRNCSVNLQLFATFLAIFTGF